MKRFLIIQTASIGDVVLATPLLEQLHRTYPEASIDLLLKKGTETLFLKHPFLRKIYIWDKSGRKYRNLWVLLGQIQENKYDYVINLQRFASSGLLTAFSRAKHTIGFSKNPFSLFFGKRIKHIINKEGRVHECGRNLELLAGLIDEVPTDIRPRLYPSAKDYARMSPYKMQEYICLAPSSLWFTKEWPEEKWTDFVRQLPEEINVYLLGSAADKNKCTSIIDASKRSNCISFAGELSFLESAALMRDARMNFVNDSAPMHLASAVNAPVCAVFCSTVPGFGFGPLSERAFVVEAKTKLSCRPCGLHGLKQCPESHFKCARDIEVQQLLELIEE